MCCSQQDSSRGEHHLWIRNHFLISCYPQGSNQCLLNSENLFWFSSQLPLAHKYLYLTTSIFRVLLFQHICPSPWWNSQNHFERKGNGTYSIYFCFHQGLTVNGGILLAPGRMLVLPGRSLFKSCQSFENYYIHQTRNDFVLVESISEKDKTTKRIVSHSNNDFIIWWEIQTMNGQWWIIMRLWFVA